jgi:YgiT-type zinc finger domain-containing protein
MRKKATQKPCTDCGGRVRPKTITQEYERDGVRVSVSGVKVLECEKCGEIYFEPGGAQALVEAVESLFALAKQTHQHKGKLVGAIS